ncbi:uncharacterized protein LOC110818389 isoform X2 [Carica papaya]|uniref:uncharacterized protein LOC110818389 isoform X2 n=1 Tax=Carica papaya TaxID=3649 RepID=UPI000B8C7505|nr:uncharacterized protein LOC110818389 isoform X2 [Carica papaya]
MPVSGKPKTARPALRDLPNNARNGRFSSKSAKSKKKLPEKVMENEKEKSLGAKEEDDGSLDRLLLVHSNLSSLSSQIDELVVQAIKLDAMGKQGRKEIESFTSILSEMLSSLEPWVPRFQKALSTTSRQTEKELEQSLASKTVSYEVKAEVKSPEQIKLDSLISPSPLVSWRAGCDVERGRQLFLLTPLPISKALSSKLQDSSKPAFERFPSTATQLNSLATISRESNDPLPEGSEVSSASNKPTDSAATVAGKMLEDGFLCSPTSQRKDHSMLVMTPCLKMSPPKSCILLEPLFESRYHGNKKVIRSTPYPVGIHNSSDSQTSESSGSEYPGALALKYPELLGIQHAYKSGIGKNDIETSPDWSFSPPKSCALLEPPDERSIEKIDNKCNLPVISDIIQPIENSLSKANNEPAGGSLALIKSTPLWREPERTIQTGKRPGENTLKKELWTRFEAASTYGFHYNASTSQKTSKKGFLDMLEEAFCDGESSVLDVSR